MISFLEENKTLFFTAIASVTSVFSFALLKLIQFIVVIFFILFKSFILYKTLIYGQLMDFFKTSLCVLYLSTVT